MARMYDIPHNTNIRLYPACILLSALYASSNIPTDLAASIPPTAPPRPPIPETELTAFIGNWSATVVSNTPFHMVCAAAATAMIITLSHTLLLKRISITGNAIHTQINMVNFLLLLTVHPILIKYDESHPPAIESIAVTTYTTVSGTTISFFAIPLLVKKDGNQNK